MKRKQKLNSCLVIMLSSSMAFTSVAAPLTPDVGLKAQTRYEASKNEIKATASNATRETSDVREEYPKFATEAFWDWYQSSSGEEKREWHLIISLGKGTASNAEESFPIFDLESEEFLDWYMDNCLMNVDENSMTLNYELIYEYIQTMDYASAIELLDFIYSSLNAQIMMMSSIGNLWPSSYGMAADFLSHGNGTENNPYVLDSVADLRGLATYVAMGQDDSDTYYKICSGTYDLNGTWIPIGFPVNDGGNYTAFKGHITAEDGVEIINFGIGTNTTLGIDGTLVNAIRAQENVGFFGYLGADSTVENLLIETDGNTIEGTVNVGILAGKATDASIRNCTVRGYVKGNRNVGGIVGYIESSSSSAGSRSSVIEDCSAEDVAVYIVTSDSEQGAVGGIAGFAKNTVIADVFVSTNTGAGKHIYGTSSTYTGGVVGILRNSDIYNSYVSKGEIGDSQAFANGGIIGGYDGGQIKVARFSGTVNRPSSTNNYSACFIGTRINNAGFTYGENGNIAYLFADSETKANTGICGSKVVDDNNYGLNAHIGYWHSADRMYTLLTGANTSPSSDYFYQELEKGILNIMKNGNTDDILINHFTANNQGNPVRGYLLAINEPRVGGTIAAKITAQVQGSFKPVVTADNLGAYQAGDRIYVSFVNQSNGNVQFRLDPDQAPNPYYTYQEYGDFGRIDDVEGGLYSDGGYWLTMPESDTIIGAHYKSAAKSVTLTPSKMTIEVVQERSGNRDTPTVKWYATAKNDSGAIITDANGNVWNKLELKTDGSNPEFYIDSLINGQTNDTFDLSWSTGNTEASKIINNAVSVNGNATDKKAKFTINITDSKMVDKTDELRNQQSAEGNRNSMTTNSPYHYHALITGIAQTGDGIDANVPPKGFLDIDIKFNIVDNTNVSIEGVSLSKNTITYDVVRTLSGDRANPTTTYSINGQAVGTDDNAVSALTATFKPDYFNNERVKWYLSTPNPDDIFEEIKGDAVEGDEGTTDDGTILVAVTGSGDKAYYNASVTLKGITSTECTNATLVPIINAQNLTYTNELKAVPKTVTTYEKYVKVTARDTNTNSVTDTCKIIVNFSTEDRTEIMPTNVKIDNATNIGGYRIHYKFAGDRYSEVLSSTITRDNDVTVTPLVNGVGQKLTATVSPQKDNSNPEYQPYDDSVVWSLANPNAGTGSNIKATDVLSIDAKTGQITVRGYDGQSSQGLGYSPWVQSLIAENKLDGTSVTVRVIATSKRDGSLIDYKDIDITFIAETMVSQVEAGIEFDVVLTKEIHTSLAGTTITEREIWNGIESQLIDATSTGTNEAPIFTVYGDDGETISTGIISLSDSLARSITANKYVNLNQNADWIKSVIANRESSNKGSQRLIIKAKTTNGASIKEIPVSINFRYDGVDLKAGTLAAVPNDYIETPAVITQETPANTYDVSKAKVNDRTITLDVVATQGNYSINNPETRKWSYGIAKLDNMTFTNDGVKQNDATYVLSGEIANYARVDENGHLIPTKGYWEDIISSGNTKGNVEGIVTAQKEIGGKMVTDSFKVTINFRYDKAVLESNEETFNVIYTQDSLTNSAKSHWKGDDYIQLVAHISDADGKDITPKWESSDEGIATVDADGRVRVNKDTWMKQIIDAAQTYGNDVHSGTQTVLITAKHPVTGATADTCTVTVNFRYDQALLDSHEEVFNIVMTQTSRTNHPQVSWSGNDVRGLNAKIFVEPGGNNRAYWSSEDTSLIKVNENGKLEPVIDADWMKQLIAAGKYSGQKRVTVNVTNADGTVKDSCNVMINFQYENIVMAENSKTLDVVLTATGKANNPTYTFSGNMEAQLAAVINSKNPNEQIVLFDSGDETILAVSENGVIKFVTPSETNVTTFNKEASAFVKEAIKNPYKENGTKYISTTQVVIVAASEDGRMADQCNVTVNLKFIDNTTSSGGSSSSSGGGGGGGSTGVTTSGSKTQNTVLPSYVVSGQWTQTANGKWLFTSGRTYANEWAAVSNPYADTSKGQSSYDWFRFDSDGFMVTGWYKEEAGDTYYLNPISDNTQGRMFTGWNWIKGEDGKERCYYFNPVSDGYRGRLYKDCITPDGFKVDIYGAWVDNGTVVTR